MRAALFLLAVLLLTASLAAAEEFSIKPGGGDATGSILAITTQGYAYCGGSQCVAVSLDGDAYCYGPFCASVAEGNTYCQALVCPAVSIFGNSTAIGRSANLDANLVAAISVFGNAHSDRTKDDQNDVAISGTGDASSDTVAISVFGRARSNSDSDAFAVGGCDLAAQLCMDPL